MVTTMMPRPPQWPLLRRGRPQPGQHKLKDTGRSKRLMTKVSMVSGREPEHPDYQGEKADHQSCRAHTGPRHGQTGYVDANERQAAKNVDGIGTAPGQDSRGRPVRQDFPRGWNASASQPILLQSPPCEEWSDVGPSTSKIEEEGHRIAAASL